MPVHISDLKRDKFDILIDLINHDNGTHYTRDDLMFDEPVVLENEDRNTSMTIYGVNPPRTTGEVTIRYNRVNISELAGAPRLSIYVNGRTDFNSILWDINYILGTNLVEGDFVNDLLPVFNPDNPGTLIVKTLYVTYDNPVYCGQVDVMLHN